MNYLLAILEDIAGKYVYQKALASNLENNGSAFALLNEDEVSTEPSLTDKIYGASITGIYREPSLEIYHDENCDFTSFEPIFRAYTVKIKGIPVAKPTAYQLNNGTGIAHQTLQGYGTLGGFVLDSYSLQDKILILSNNHVLTNFNQGKQGDDIVKKGSTEAIGQLERFVPLQLPPQRNVIDVAVASVYKDYFEKDYTQYRLKVSAPKVGMTVFKEGAKTGLTSGKIISINAAMNIHYPTLGTLNFVKTLIIKGEDIEPFALPGDSGSLIRHDKNGAVVGLLYSGDKKSNLTFACSMEEVIAHIGIKF
jgi:hypothetical protein